jgi:segregation and condensation protein A
MPAYTIKLPNFEGPFDLLLFFIKRDELNIYDIPIAQITSDFLEYVRLIELFDLEMAGEFMVMAASLMQIKALMLLPREENPEQSEEEQDPRVQLMERLLVYKQFKEAAEDLQQRSDSERYRFYRTFFEPEQQHLGSNDALRNATLFDLMRALKKALDRAQNQPRTYEIERRPLTVEEKVSEIKNLLQKKNAVAFFELIEYADRAMIVITFLALLDMARQRIISVVQQDSHQDIFIQSRNPDQEYIPSPEDESEPQSSIPSKRRKAKQNAQEENTQEENNQEE